MAFLKTIFLALSITLPLIDGYDYSSTPITATASYLSHSTPHDYIVTMIQLNWHAAYSFCEQNGWDLLKIESAEEQFELENFLNYFNLEHETFWTSGHSLEDLHHFRWDYNGLYLNYTNWDVDQPDNHMGREHCIRLTEKYTKWDDYACEKRLHFICQRRKDIA